MAATGDDLLVLAFDEAEGSTVGDVDKLVVDD
jgi:hypothetical protein